MAIKIRCQQCRKKISIDEAFAGGNCRCPYCKAITMVSGGGAVSHAARPDSPGRPGSPTAVAVAQARQVESAEAIPLAKPVMIQGIVALVMSALVLLLLVVGVVLVVRMSTGPDKPPAPNGGMGQVTNGTNGTDVNGDDDNLPPMPDPTNPFTTRGRQVAGMGIAHPVVYIIDASSGMRDLYDPAVAVVRYSIRAMGRVGRFNVIVLSEEAVKPMADEWTTGGDAGDTKVNKFLRAYQPAGATDLAEGFRRALALKPKTVVVLTGKAVGGADKLAKQAKQAGVGVFAVMLEAPPDAVKVMEKLAAGTGGQCRQFTGDEIADLLSEAEPLP